MPENYVSKLSVQIMALERQLNILKSERAARILSMRRSGATLGDIAAVAGITRQRVLQVVQRYEGKNAAR